MSQQQKKEIIVYIYSDFSPCCKQVQPKVIELSQKLQLYILNIDNKRIRRMILRCKKIKITKVPCLLIINPEVNKVELYEGNNFLQAFDTLYNTFIVQPKMEEQQKFQLQQQMALQAQQEALQTQQTQQTQMMSNIPQEMQYTSDNGNASGNKGTKRISPLNLVIDKQDSKSQPQQPNVINANNAMQQINDDMIDEPVKAPAKKKLGRNTFINDASLMPFDEEGIVAGSSVKKPNRGEGHENMAQSSLPEIGLTQDYVVSKKDVVANRESISVDTKSPVEIDEDEDEIMYDREISLPGNTIKTKMGDNKGNNNEVITGGKKVPMKVGGKTAMILDLSEALDESDSLFTSKEDINIEEMRGGPPKNDVKTQKMSAAKMAAEQMMKERNSMMDKNARN